jgi:hypothetical protein
MPRIAELERRYHGDQLGFVYLYPNRTDSNDEKAAFHRRHGLRAPLVDDKGAVIASALGATRTSEVILVDERAVIRYRGAIDDARDEAAVVERHAAHAIDALLAGRPIAVSATKVDA